MIVEIETLIGKRTSYGDLLGCVMRVQTTIRYTAEPVLFKQGIGIIV